MCYILHSTTLGKFRRSRDMNDVTWLVERQIWACINHRYTCTAGPVDARSSINLGNTRRFCILNELCKFILRDMISTRYVVCSSISRFYTMHTVQKCEWTDIYGEMRFLYFVYLAVKRFWTWHVSEHSLHTYQRYCVYRVNTIDCASCNVTRVYVGARFRSQRCVSDDVLLSLHVFSELTWRTYVICRGVQKEGKCKWSTFAR